MFFSVGRTSCYFLLAQKVTKDAPRGVSPMNASQGGRSKSPHPLDPHLRERIPLDC